MRIRLDARTTATVIAALRLYQHTSTPDWVIEIANDDGKFDPLDDIEITDLITRIKNAS